MTDPRSTFARPEIAHISLRGRVPARRFAAGALHRVITPTAGIYASPEDTALQRQCLFGHPVRTLPHGTDARVFGRCETSGYVGFFDRAALGPQTDPTHLVSARRTLAFPEPDFKSPPVTALSLGSLVTVTDIQGRFAQTHDGAFLPLAHVTGITNRPSDPVAVAERCLSAPYLWGGNGSDGLDCSGLVSLALTTCGLPCPGDSDQQQDKLGTALPPDTPHQRGDLLFWRGHVALVSAADTLIHANAWHMAVAHEPIAQAITRIAAQGDGPVTAHKRLSQS